MSRLPVNTGNVLEYFRQYWEVKTAHNQVRKHFIFFILAVQVSHTSFKRIVLIIRTDFIVINKFYIPNIDMIFVYRFISNGKFIVVRVCCDCQYCSHKYMFKEKSFGPKTSLFYNIINYKKKLSMKINLIRRHQDTYVCVYSN